MNPPYSSDYLTDFLLKIATSILIGKFSLGAEEDSERIKERPGVITPGLLLIGLRRIDALGYI